MDGHVGLFQAHERFWMHPIFLLEAMLPQQP